jgi:hypothetical protein
MADYPKWSYYPGRNRPPKWALDFVTAVDLARSKIESANVAGLTSNKALAILRPHLLPLGYTVEEDSSKAKVIRRPVLFGEQGKERVAYQVDAVHDELGIVVEIEAGRGARGNAVYRDLIRSSLIVDAEFLILGVMQVYRHKSGARSIEVAGYAEAKNALDAIYASGRLQLPFKGVLLFGY